MYSFVRNQNTEHKCFYIRSFAGLDSVEIIIRAKQKDLNGKVEIVEHKAQGSYGCKGGKHYIRYMDKHLSPKEQVPTVIKLGDRELTIIRQGLVSIPAFFFSPSMFTSYPATGSSIATGFSIFNPISQFPVILFCEEYSVPHDSLSSE